jgi:S1/P1 Nuclease
MMRDSVRSHRWLWRVSLAVACGLCAVWPWRASFGWGREGHAVVGVIAEHYMSGAALTRAGQLLGGSSIDAVASWADDYRRDHPENGPWHYIDIPLADPKIDLARECPKGDCVVVKTEQFLAVLKDPGADSAKKAEALRFVIYFVGDMHQPLHDEDDGDKGGNARHVIFYGKPDNLHWVWDTGLLEHINRNPEALAAELESRITPRDRAEWEKGTVEDWVLEGHRLAATVAYGDLDSQNPAPITAAYERQADAVIKLQLEKAGVRLAYLLNGALR